MRSSELQS
jgi:glycosyl transferase family 25